MIGTLALANPGHSPFDSVTVLTALDRRLKVLEGLASNFRLEMCIASRNMLTKLGMKKEQSYGLVGKNALGFWILSPYTLLKEYVAKLALA